MPDVIHVRHPVPVRNVPRRARNPRVTFVAATTPVVLREARPSDLQPLPFRTMEEGQGHFHAFEGRLWLRLLARQPEGRPVSPAAFARALASPEPPEGEPLLKFFARSPLLGLRDHPEEMWHDRGAPPGSLAGSRIVEDLADPAGRALRDFLDRDVVIAGDGVFLRCTPMLCQMTPQVSTDLRLLMFPRRRLFRANACHIDDARAFVDLQRRTDPHGLAAVSLMPRGHAVLGHDPRSLPRGLVGDDDLHLVLNQMATYLDWAIQRFPAGLPPQAGDAAREALSALLPRLARLGALGRIGALDPQDAEADAAFLHQACLLHREACQIPRRWEFEVGYIERFMLPRLRAQPPVPEEDERALTDLGLPGM